MGGLLLVEAFLFVSADYRLFDYSKGWASFLSVAVAFAGLVLLLAWVGVSHFLKQRAQFGLGTLLAMILVLALPCAWVANEMHKAKPQQELAQSVERDGGWLIYDRRYQYDEYLHQRWLLALFGRDYFLDIAHVILDNGDLVDKLRVLPQLKSVCFRPNATDSDLKNLNHFPQLEWIDLNKSQITNDGLAYLADLPKLESIYLDGTNVTDDGLMQLSKFRSLKCVRVNFAIVTKDGITRLKESLPGLIIDGPADRPSFPRAHRN